MDEGEGSGFNMEKLSKAAENSPAKGSPSQSPTIQGSGAKGGQWAVALSPHSWALCPLPFALLLWDWPCCHASLCCDQALSEGAGGAGKSPTPGCLLDDFLLGDGWLGDGRGRLDDCGDGPRQELVGLGP